MEEQNNLIQNQAYIDNSNIIPNDIPLLQALPSLCKIFIKEQISSGFLIKFFKGDKDFFCLMTNEHSITKDLVAQKEKFRFYFKNEDETREIILDPSERYIKDFTCVGIDAIVIEILPKDDIKNDNFLLANLDYLYNSNELINKDIIILQYPKGKSSYSLGKIKDIKNNYIFYSASTTFGSSGSPIFLKGNMKVIGIHKGSSGKKDLNLGLLIGPIFSYFRNMEEKNNVSNKLNKMTINVSFERGQKSIQLFGKKFVENNKNNCYLLIDGQKYNLSSSIELNEKQKRNGDLVIKLIENETITDMSYLLFSEKNIVQKIINIYNNENYSSISLPDISEWDTRNITNMKGMFYDCSKLKNLPDISKWDTKNVTNMKGMFYNCSSLYSLPDISKWDTKNVTKMKRMFCKCSSLETLPDISKWDTKNVTSFEGMFCHCSSLTTLPDISRWNTKNTTSFKDMLSDCSKLISLPDISKWDTKKVIDMSGMFYNCSKIISLPDISKWDIRNVINMNGMFRKCSSLSSLPDISKWDTKNVTSMNGMFCDCSSLTYLPDISKWYTKEVKDMRDMFNNCGYLKSLPDITKWKLNENLNNEDMFKDCNGAIVPEKFKDPNCLVF